VEAPLPHALTRDAHGNRIVHLSWRGPAAGELVVRARVLRAPSGAVAAADAHPGTPLDPARYTAAARRIPLNGLIQHLGEQQSRGAADPAEKVRSFYAYVTANMKYSKHGEGWGQGDAVWACSSRYGNCTDFHSVFIGMARSQGIPARFLIGFPIPAHKDEGEIPGYHCWSEAWLPDTGWWPLDASEAWKSGRIEDYYGTLPSDRIRFSVGRDLVLSPPQAGEPLNYFIYPYAELDGVAVEKLPARFRFRRLSATAASR
jgi:transglutaminase-like putative cysteine protease